MKYQSLILCFSAVALRSQIPHFPDSHPPTASSMYRIPEENYFPAKGSVASPTISIPSHDIRSRNRSRQIPDTEQIRKDIQRQEMEMKAIASAKEFMLPSLADKEGTKAYYNAFENLLKLDPDHYSLANATFLVENAYYNNDKQFRNTYENGIQKATKLIRSQIKQKGIDEGDNVSKNLAIFKYFADDTRQNGKIIHKKIKYDFDDYFGSKDRTKMFVSKLMSSNSGQCHSMPLLYLILAEQLNAEAFLVISPNHSYIRFKDNKGEMLSIELTNGMFSANSFVLNSGYIKSEALQNKIYMQNLSKKEVLSNIFTDLASGYVNKFGYDEFVAKVIIRALQLNPNNIHATLWKSNTDQKRFLEACTRKGINPENREQLQNIKNYPQLVEQFHNITTTFDYIDHSGYAAMPTEQYGKWLGSLKNTENQQKSEEIAERIRNANAQRQKNQQQKPKSVTPVKEAPKVYTIPKELL